MISVSISVPLFTPSSFFFPFSIDSIGAHAKHEFAQSITNTIFQYCVTHTMHSAYIVAWCTCTKLCEYVESWVNEWSITIFRIVYLFPELQFQYISSSIYTCHMKNDGKACIPVCQWSTKNRPYNFEKSLKIFSVFNKIWSCDVIIRNLLFKYISVYVKFCFVGYRFASSIYMFFFASSSRYNICIWPMWILVNNNGHNGHMKCEGKNHTHIHALCDSIRKMSKIETETRNNVNKSHNNTHTHTHSHVPNKEYTRRIVNPTRWYRVKCSYPPRLRCHWTVSVHSIQTLEVVEVEAL